MSRSQKPKDDLMTTLIGDFYVILRKEEQYQALLVDAIVSS